MSMSNSAENSFLLLIFNATAWADLAQNDGSSPATDLHVSLHTSDPGEAGVMNSNETTYGSYARVAVERTSSGWTVTNNSVSPAAAITFPEATSGTATITHFGVGIGSSGATALLFSGTVTPNISVATGVTPILTTATAITID
jgi:hypothetical protein